MYRNGELAGFRLGKLIRIPAAEVERYECQNTPSLGTEENGASLSVKEEGDYASRLVRQTGELPKLEPVRFGREEVLQKASG